MIPGASGGIQTYHAFDPDMQVEMVKGIDPSLSIHDFRMVPGTTHTNLIFDVVVPHKFAMTSAQLLKEMETRIHVKHPDFYLVVTFDHAFISERKPV